MDKDNKKDKKKEETEAVKIRIGVKTKIRLQEIAEREYRSFQDQCRLALDEWIEIKSKRTEK